MHRPSPLLLLPLAALALSCANPSANHAPHSSVAAVNPDAGSPVAISVAGTIPARDVQRHLADQLKALGFDSTCSLVWGDIPNMPAGVRPAVVTIASTTVEGWLVCGEAQQAALLSEQRDPRLHQILMVGWKQGRFWGSHPSGPGSREVDLAERPDPNGWRTYAVFMGSNDAAPASEMAPALKKLTPAFVFVQWPLHGKETE